MKLSQSNFDLRLPDCYLVRRNCYCKGKSDVFLDEGMPRWQKLGRFLQNKVVQNLLLSKNVNSNSNLENLNLPIFVTSLFPFQIIYIFPLNLVFFMQKQTQTCVHMFPDLCSFWFLEKNAVCKMVWNCTNASTNVEFPH